MPRSSLHTFPGFPALIIDQAIRHSDVRGIILQGFGSGNLSEQYLGVVQLAQEMKIPVVVTTQVSMYRYE